jgi:4-hydroxybenzoate polyprenyltransferase
MRFFLYSHIYISLAAVAMTFGTFRIYRHAMDKNSLCYLVLIFLATWLVYNIKSIFYKNEPVSEKQHWIRTNRYWLRILYPLVALVALYFAWLLPVQSTLMMIPFAWIAIGYFTPFFWYRKRIALREIPFLKTWLVAGVWTFAVAFLPCTIMGLELTSCWRWVLLDFLFMFALTMLFDIKDLTSDKLQGLRTLPMYWGVQTTKIISCVLLLVRLLIVFLSCKFFAPGWVCAEVFLTGVLIFMIIKKIKKETDEKVYLLQMDGFMLLKPLLIFLLVS